MRKVWLLLMSILVIMGLTLSGCAPELSGCAPGVVGGGAAAELEEKLDWIKDKLQSMQVELAELEEKLDWVKDKLGDMQVEIREIKPEAEVEGAEKLVGVGMLGETGYQDQWWDTLFIITNPDSEENITVDKVVVTREDEKLIYSGPYLVYQGGDMMQEAEDQVLTPHEAWQLRLSQYKYDPDTEEWIDPEDAIDQELEKYTVEVFWHAEEDTCPLTGWFKQIKTTLVYDHECVEWEIVYEAEPPWRHYLKCTEWEEFPGYQKAVTEASMVNVRQVH